MGENRIRNIRFLAIWLLAMGILLSAVWLRSQAKVETVPGSSGPCSIAFQEVELSGASVSIFYPNNNQCNDHMAEPFASVAFAHGFSMFGLSDGVAENQALGEHLASWGYVTAIPALPDDAEQRIDVLLDTLDFLAAAADDSESFLYQKVDTKRLTTAGYSLGGSTALAIAARDARIKAVVALDPVYHKGGFAGEGEPIWDPVSEAPKISVPAGILGAPASSCNAEADYVDIYPLIGSKHKASYHVSDASHCVFSNPGSSYCSWFCTGTIEPEMTTISKKYMTAWLNYYMQLQPDYYDYLFGMKADADVVAGSVVIRKDTAPTNLTASTWRETVQLQWDIYEHPLIAGYHIYRRLPEETSFGQSLATLGLISRYVDDTVVVGQTYTYAVRSFDMAGNLHERSDESTITVAPESTDSTDLILPLVTRN